MSDEAHVVELLHLLQVTDGYGEQQFVVLAAVQGTGGHIHVHLLGHHRCLIVDGNLLLVDATTNARLLADVHQFAGKTIADVHHRRGTDASLAQFLDDVATSLGLQLALQQILLAGKVGTEVGQLLEGFLVALLLGVVHLTIIHALLALQQLQPHIGSTQVARDADEVGVLGTVAIDDVLLLGLADTGDADGQTRIGRGGIATHDVDAPFLAGQAQSGIKLLHVLHGEALAQSQRYGDLARRAVHGKDVADVDHRRLIAQMLEVDIGEVEVDTFHQ